MVGVAAGEVDQPSPLNLCGKFRVVRVLTREDWKEGGANADALALGGAKITPIGEALLPLLARCGGELQIVVRLPFRYGVGKERPLKLGHRRQVFARTNERDGARRTRAAQRITAAHQHTLHKSGAG